MRAKHLLCLPILAAALAALGAPAAEQPEADSEHAQRMARTYELIADFEEGMGDAVSLARAALDLTEPQQKQIRALAARREEEIARWMTELRHRYAGEVREVLEEEQAARYDAVLSALEDLSERIADARAELMEELGAADALDEVPGDRLHLSDPTEFLELDEETRTALLELRLRTHRELSEIVQDLPDPETLKDPDAWRQYRERYRQSQQKVQDRFEAERAELLTPEQLERLEQLRGAVETYRQRLQQARRETFQTIYRLLGGQPEAAPEPERERSAGG